MQVVTETNIPELTLLSRGKVRDIYEIDADKLLVVTTDRMSAFDVIMNEPIPYKGVVLNQITLFWMKRFENIIQNHLIEHDIARFPAELQKHASQLEGRSVIVKRAKPLPLECIVRNYITGSGWKDYQATGSLCGYTLPVGLVESDRLTQPLFTPSTKAELGEHDENISVESAKAKIGAELFKQVEQVSLAIFNEAKDYAEKAGIIVADTKFEFGMYNNQLIIIDEVLTPDSSRFWPLSEYKAGQSQPSFDKQYLRDWLETQPWNKKAPAPTLPKEVKEKTAAKYFDAYEMLTGSKLVINEK